MRIVLLASVIVASVIVASVIVAGVIVAGAPVEARAADVEANKALLRRSIEEIWNQRNPEAADRYIAADLIEHNPNIPQGLEGRKKFIAAVQAAFSDYHAEVQEIIAEGDRAGGADRVDRHAGRHFPGPPGDRQQAALLDVGFPSHRKRQVRRALGRRRQPAARDSTGARAAASKAGGWWGFEIGCREVQSKTAGSFPTRPHHLTGT